MSEHQSADIAPPTHHPTLYSAGRHGCWACCLCGWKSDLYTTTSGAHLAFGEHIAGGRIPPGQDERS